MGYHIPKWYRDHSWNVIGNSHSAFSPDRVRKPSKRYGHLVRSEKTELQAMLEEHQAEVIEFIEKRM